MSRKNMPSEATESQSLLGELVAKGVRMTSQRRALVQTIQESTTHLDAAALLERAREHEPNLNRATVYRTLELLKKFRLVDELDLMHLEGEKHFYEVRTRKDHIHLACFRCGRIEEYASPAYELLKAEIASNTGFEIKVTRLEAGGVCQACSADAGPISTAMPTKKEDARAATTANS